MRRRPVTPRTLVWLAGLTGLALPALAAAQAPAAPPVDKQPVPRLEGGGPTSFVTGLAFAPDGKQLFAVGFDKVVRVWRPGPGGWTLDRTSYRVPIGPGLNGALNALAVSADGEWIATAGMGVIRDLAGFRQKGQIVPSAGVSKENFLDLGQIFVFHPRDGSVRVLRGHLGAVVGLAFGPSRDGGPPVLASAAQRWDFGKEKYLGDARLWDVDKSAELAVHRLPAPGSRVRLTVQATGVGPKQVRVGLAWADKTFRLWDAETDRLVVNEWDGDGKDIAAIVRLPGNSPRVLSASVQNNSGCLRVWPADATDTPQPAYTFDGRRWPRDLALVSSRGDGRADQVAVVLETDIRPAEPDGPVTYAYSLQLLDLRTWTAVGKEVPLWKGSHNEPALAAALPGGYLAAAGNDRHEILVFSVPQLQKGAAKPQALRGAGDTLLSAAFAVPKKGEGLGLVLHARPKAETGGKPPALAEGDLLFDLTRQRLAEATDAWRVAGPAAGGWSVRAVPDEKTEGGRVVRWALVVRKGDEEVRRVRLPAGQEYLDDFVLRPPGEGRPTPILAVATHGNGATNLALYNAQTGERFRVLTGHTNTIRSLAYSPDGRLLVSAAKDQTINVWSLSNVERFLGRYGLVRGVAVKRAGKQLVLGRVNEAEVSPANLKALKDAGVEDGNEIEGLIEGEKVRPLATSTAYFEAIYRLRPGQVVTLKIAGKNVALQIGQAIDERKPLFTLFVTRGIRPQDRDWIAWTPLGPYEYSDRKAERWLSWHFNVGRAGKPAAVDAGVDQWHKEFYKGGILKHLVARADISEAVKAWEAEELRKPVPQPVLKPWIEGVPPGAERPGQAVLVRTPPATLKLMIGNLPPERVGAVEWQVERAGQAAGPRQKFADGDGPERSADVSAVAWQRGLYKVRVFVRTRAEQPAETAEEFALRYAPPSPVLADAAPLPAVVAKAELVWPLTVKPGSAGRPTRLRFVHRHGGNAIAAAPAQPKEVELKEAGEVKRTFTLQPGENVLEAIAVDPAAGPDDEPFEAARAVRTVVFQLKPAPRIGLETIIPVGSEKETHLVVEPGRAVVVNAPSVRVRGKIVAEAELTEATWQLLAAAPKAPTRLSGFAAKGKEFAIEQTLRLEPGKQRFRFTAKAGDAEGSAEIEIDYRPELPPVFLTLPQQGQALYAPEDAAEIEVRTLMVPKADQQPYRIALLVNGKEQKVFAVDPKAKESIAKGIKLEPGPNRIEARAGNEWGAEATTEAVVVRYLRPPLVRPEEILPASPRPQIALKAAVQSASPLHTDRAEVTVNGKVAPVRAEFVAPAKPGGDWQVKLTEVPLEKGPNEIRLWVSNADARSRQPALWAVAFQPAAQAPPPPDVTVVEPATDARVTEPRIAVRLRIRSANPPARVEVLREVGVEVLRLPVPAAQVRPAGAGTFEAAIEVPLLPGTNPLRAVAGNAGGQGEATLAVSYLQVPVELVVEQVVPFDGGPAVKPTVRSDGRIIFTDAAPQGRVRLYGKVLWEADDDSNLRTAQTVRVFVNGFQQPPAKLKPVVAASAGEGKAGPAAAERKERKFTAELVLNQKTGNLIEIELPGLKQRTSSRRALALDCAARVPVTRWHVLPVVVQRKDEKRLDPAELTNEVRRTFPAAEKANVVVHGPLTRYVDAGQILLQLTAIKRTIDQAGGSGSANDVVLIYYRGGEAVTPDGHFLLTSVSQHDPDLPNSAVGLDGVARLAGETLGAQVLLLDLVRDSKVKPGGKLNDRVAQWPDDPSVGVVRYSRAEPDKVRLLDDLRAEAAKTGRLADAIRDLAKRQFVHRSEVGYWELPGALGFRFDWRLADGLGGLGVGKQP